MNIKFLNQRILKKDNINFFYKDINFVYEHLLNFNFTFDKVINTINMDDNIVLKINECNFDTYTFQDFYNIIRNLKKKSKEEFYKIKDVNCDIFNQLLIDFFKFLNSELKIFKNSYLEKNYDFFVLYKSKKRNDELVLKIVKDIMFYYKKNEKENKKKNQKEDFYKIKDINGDIFNQLNSSIFVTCMFEKKKKRFMKHLKCFTLFNQNLIQDFIYYPYRSQFFNIYFKFFYDFQIFIKILYPYTLNYQYDLSRIFINEKPLIYTKTNFLYYNIIPYHIFTEIENLKDRYIRLFYESGIYLEKKNNEKF